MEGLWIASDEFCNKSEIEGMLLFIGPRTGFLNESRRAYLIMYAENKIVINEKLTMHISGYGNIWPIRGDVCCDVELDNKTLEKFMPAELTMKVNIGSGSMILENDSTVYAELHKDTLSLREANPEEIHDSDKIADTEKSI
jgi:hypothetical protein